MRWRRDGYSALNDLSPAGAIRRCFALMPNDQDSNATFEARINHRVRKYLQREYSPPFAGAGAEIRILAHQVSDTLELCKKTSSNRCACVSCLEVQCVGNVLLGLGVERVGHRESLARSLAIASWPGTAFTAPEASSASRRSASCSQACSTSGSESRLAISRSSKCERSAEGNFSTSASKTSRVGFMLIFGAVNTSTG